MAAYDMSNGERTGNTHAADLFCRGVSGTSLVALSVEDNRSPQEAPLHSNARILAMDQTRVTFRYKDRRSDTWYSGPPIFVVNMYGPTCGSKTPLG